MSGMKNDILIWIAIAALGVMTLINYASIVQITGFIKAQTALNKILVETDGVLLRR